MKSLRITLSYYLSQVLWPALRVAAVIVAVSIASSPSFAQKDSGVPEDWSHHHVVFSDPGTFSDAVARGSFHRWYSIVTDPRYMHQQVKRNSPIHKRHNGGNGSSAPANQADPLSRDWSASLGGAGVAPDMYPAKWQFSEASNTASCSDYVVFPVNNAGVSGSQPNIVEYQNLYVNGAGTGFCSGLTAPTVLFSYFVGTGTVQTSPVLGGAEGQVA